MGVATGVVDKKGAWLQFQGQLIGQGREAARQALLDKPELTAQIIQSINEKRTGAQPIAA